MIISDPVIDSLSHIKEREKLQIPDIVSKLVQGHKDY